MRLFRFTGRAFVSVWILLAFAAVSGAERVVDLRGGTGKTISSSSGQPRLNRFPGVIGGGPLRPLLPGSGRTYTDLLMEKESLSPSTIRIAVLRVEFENDSAGDITTSDGRFDLSNGRDTWMVDAPPHDSTYFHTHLEVLRRFYDAQSYGKLRIEWEIFPKSLNGAYRLHDSANYLPEGNAADWDMQDHIDHLVRHCTDALHLVDTVDAAVDFSEYDGYMIIHPGPDMQTDINGDSPGDTPSFFLSYGDSDQVWVDCDGPDSVLIQGVTMIPEYTSQDGFIFGLNGVIAHEFGHQLGLPDLYNTNYSWPAIGVWGLMDSGGMVSIDAGGVYLGSIIPASLCAWSKLYLGWATPEVITAPAALSLACATDRDPPGEMPHYAIIPLNDREYFILENRYGLAEEYGFVAKIDTVNNVILGPITNDENETFTCDFDYALPGWGLLVWHVNNRHLDPQYMAYENSVNVDYNDRAVELEEADGIKDLGNPYSAYWDGSPYDPFFEGNAIRFGPGTAPNSDLTDGAKSNVVIENVGPPGRAIHFTVDPGFAMPGWPLPVLADSSSVEPFDLIVTDSGTVAAFWIQSDSIDTVYGVTVAVPDTGDVPVIRRSVLPAMPEGRAVSGNVSGAHTGGEIYCFAGGHAFCIDPDLIDPVVDLGPAGHVPVNAGPLLLDVPIDYEKEYEGYTNEIITVEGESLSVYTVWEDSIRLLIRDYIPGGVLSNLAASPSEEAPPVVYFVGGDGYLQGWRYTSSNDAVFRKEVSLSSLSSVPVTLLVTDMDRNGHDDIVALTDYGDLSVVSLETGFLLPGWPMSLGEDVTGEPFITDRNGDGFPEIAVPTGTSLTLFEWNGLIAEETPYTIPPWLDRGNPLVGNGIACRTEEGSAPPVLGDLGGRLWRWTGEGNVADGWPVSSGSANHVVAVGPVAEESGAALYAFPADGLLYAWPFHEADGGNALWSGPGGGSRRRYTADLASLTAPASPQAGAARITNAYAYPNPVRGSEVAVRYTLTAESNISLHLNDMTGQRVSVVSSGVTGYFGVNEVVIDVGNLASGLYFVRLETGAEIKFVKVAIVR